MKFKDYYKILEVNRNTSDEVIKMAYKALVKKYHPDLNKENMEVANFKIKEINEAYAVLGDCTKRQIYNNEYDKYKIREKENSNHYSYSKSNTSNYYTSNNEQKSNKYANKLSFREKIIILILVIISIFIFFIGFEKAIYPLIGLISLGLLLFFKNNNKSLFNYIYFFIIILFFISLVINIHEHSGYLYFNDSYKFYYYFN